MAFLLLKGCPAKDDTLIHQHIVTNISSFPDHYPCTMVDEKPSADNSAGMNLDCCQESSRVRDATGEQAQSMSPEIMSKSVKQQGMYSGVEEKHLKFVPSRGVSSQSSPNVLSEGIEQFNLLVFTLRFALERAG